MFQNTKITYISKRLQFYSQIKLIKIYNILQQKLEDIQKLVESVSL